MNYKILTNFDGLTCQQVIEQGVAIANHYQHPYLKALVRSIESILNDTVFEFNLEKSIRAQTKDATLSQEAKEEALAYTSQLKSLVTSSDFAQEVGKKVEDLLWVETLIISFEAGRFFRIGSFLFAQYGKNQVAKVGVM